MTFKINCAAFVLIAALGASSAALAAPAGCSGKNMGVIDARADKSVVMRGDRITFIVDSCYAPPEYTIWAKFREAPDVLVPLNFDDNSRLWSFTVNVTQDIQPGVYHVDFVAKNKAGIVAFEFPQEAGLPAEVRWPHEQSVTLEKWRAEKESLIRGNTERLDKTFSSLPKFQTVGVWFDAPAYKRHHSTNSESSGAWNPFLRRNYSEEIDYISKTLGMNMVALSGGSPEENKYARAAFPNFITDAPQPGDYAIYDEPDYMNKPMADVIKWAEETKARGVKTIVNFSGHKADDTWTDYVFKFLDMYAPDVVAVDCYPVFYDFANMEYFRDRVKAVGKAAHAKKAKFFVITQGFAQLGSWSYPTTFYWQKMIEASKDAGADGILFFLWTSGADGNNFVVGIDAMPQDYHRMLRAIVAPKKAPAAVANHKYDWKSKKKYWPSKKVAKRAKVAPVKGKAPDEKQKLVKPQPAKQQSKSKAKAPVIKSK